MSTKRRNRRRDLKIRPCQSIELDLSIEEVMAELDRGWFVQPSPHRERRRAKSAA